MSEPGDPEVIAAVPTQPGARRVELTCRVVVEASAEQTWTAATDWAAQGEWMPATAVVVEAGDGSLGQGHAVGARLVARTGIGRLGFADPMEITRWEPPYRCEIAHRGRVVRGAGAFEVRPLSVGRAEFRWSEWLELPFGMFGRWAWRIVRPLAGLALDVALRRFARWVPTRPATDLA